MFNNIDVKIKTLAVVIFWIGIIGSFITGFYIIILDDQLIDTGFIVMIIGTLSSWIIALMLYGLGKLIENSQTIVEILEQETKNSNTLYNIPVSEFLKPVQLTKLNRNFDNNTRDAIIKKMIENEIDTLEKQQKEGIITEDEFNAKKKELLDS